MVEGELVPVGERLPEAARPLLPHEWDEDTRAAIAALDAASDTHASAQRPDNTTRSYRSDWRTWLEFTTELGIPATAATRGTLRAFVKWLWDEQHRAPTTIDRKLAGVVVTLRTEHRVIVDPDATAAARQLLKDYKKKAEADGEPPRGRGKAPGMRLDALRSIVAACPADLPGVRDRAIVLLGFAIAARRAELAGLRLRNIADDPNGLLVDVRVSKVEPRTVAVPFGQNPATCPVRAWQAWKTGAGLADSNGHAFRRIHATGAVQPHGLTGQRIGDLITAAGERAGIEIRFTGHSVRSGMATEGRRAGKDAKAIAATTGHRPNSSVLHGYMQIVDRWNPQDNALIGIGL